MALIHGAAFGVYFEMASGSLLDAADERVLDACAELFCLGLHVHHQLRSHDAVGETREVFDFGGRGELAAGHVAGEDQGLQVGATGVDGCRVAGAAGADDDDVFHEKVGWGGERMLAEDEKADTECNLRFLQTRCWRFLPPGL